MEARLEDVHEDPGEELVGIERCGGRLEPSTVAGTPRVGDHACLLVHVEALEAHGWAQEVAGEAIEAGAVIRRDRDRGVDGEPQVPPGQEQAGALLGEQPLAFEEAGHFVAEQERGRLAVDERDRGPHAFAVPPAAGDQRVHVGMPVEVVAEGLDHSDHAEQELLAVCRSRSDHHAGGLVGGVAEAAQERAVVEDIRPQHLREREDPLRVADIDKHLLAQERRQRRSPLGRARRAQPTVLARQGDEELGAALSTAHPGKPWSRMPQSRYAPTARSAAARQKP